MKALDTGFRSCPNKSGNLAWSIIFYATLPPSGRAIDINSLLTFYTSTPAQYSLYLIRARQARTGQLPYLNHFCTGSVFHSPVRASRIVYGETRMTASLLVQTSGALKP